MNRPHEMLPPGTQVFHGAQRWASTLVGGTGAILSASGPYNDGSYEYEVLTGRDFSRRPGPGNPMDRRTEWNSRHCRRAWTQEQEDALRGVS